MKSTLLIIMYLFSFLNSGISQDGQVRKDTQTNMISAAESMDNLNKEMMGNNEKDFEPTQPKCKRSTEISILQWIIVFFMPVTMLLFALYFAWKFRRSKEFTASRIIGLPKRGDGPDEDSLMSSSRFVALLTGLTAIFVVATLMMYYGYILVAECEIELPLTQLWTIIAGLGIGVIPYGFNVWNKNEKEKGSSNAEIRKDQ